MIVSKSPMRLSFFGGSTDYKSFYQKYGSFIIGTTINKYAYNTVRFRPKIVGNESIITYSKLEIISDFNNIQNPLIKETIKYYNVNKPIEINFASDIPSRTGLGGSSSCCASLAQSLSVLMKLKFNPKKLCNDTIKIEREILNEPGGIQDQIWACYGGFKCIEILPDSTFTFYTVPGSKEFHKEFKKSLLLIYSEKQRDTDDAAKSKEEKDKRSILEISEQAYTEFGNENIEKIGDLLYESWLEKRGFSDSISDSHVDCIIKDVMDRGAYGAKLAGSGGGGFIIVMCDPILKKKLENRYKDYILDFQFSKGGIKTIIV